MSSITFVSGTVVPAAWLNDVNGTVYTLFNGASTASAGRTALGLGTIALENNPLAVAKGGTGVATSTGTVNTVLSTSPTITTPTLTTPAITGGTISGTTITTPTLSGGTISGTPIDNSVIGGTTKAAGSFTTITGTGLVDISAAGAGQISFPATQNASAGVNVLDDYEEGTWTPGVSFGNGTTGITYGGQSGVYTKIGNMVIAHFDIVLTSKGSSTGAMRITGWPFTSSSSSTQAAFAISYQNLTTSFVATYVVLNGSSVAFSVTGNTAAATSNLTAVNETNVANNTSFSCAVNYRI